MSEVLISRPVASHKHLFLFSDLESRVRTVGPSTPEDLSGAANAKVVGPDNGGVQRLATTPNGVMYLDRATSLLTNAASSIPRFEGTGLNLEPESITQLVLATNNLSDPVWVPVGGLVVSAAPSVGVTGTLGPDGSATSFLLTNGNAGDKDLTQNILGFSAITGTSLSFSLYLKPIPGDPTPPTVQLYTTFQRANSPFTFFTLPSPLQTITLSTLPSGTPLTTGWRRFDVVMSLPADVQNGKIGIRLNNAGPGAKGVYVWGPQFTVGGATFSFRPRSSNVSNSDNTGLERLTYPIEGFGFQPNQDFTLIWEFIPIGDPILHVPLIALGGGTSDPTLSNMFNPTSPSKYIGFGGGPVSASLAVWDTVSGSPNFYTSSAYSWTKYSLQKWAFLISTSGGNVTFYANGNLISGPTPIGPLPLDGGYTKFAFLSAAIQRKLEIYPSLLADSDLRDITTP